MKPIYDDKWAGMQMMRDALMAMCDVAQSKCDNSPAGRMHAAFWKAHKGFIQTEATQIMDAHLRELRSQPPKEQQKE